MARFSGSRVIDKLPACGGGAAALIAAASVLTLPDGRLDMLMEASGFVGPPLGTSARAMLVLGAGVVSGAVTWSALYLVWGPGGLLAAPVRGAGSTPRARRAVAPLRRPVSAAGVPPWPPEPEAPEVDQPLPADLDQPLAAFDPFALPPERRAPIRPASVEPFRAAS